MRALILLGAIACGEPQRRPVPHTAAPARDPMSEASIAEDVRWLVAPERAGRGSRSAEAAATATWLAEQLTAAGYAPAMQPIAALPGQVNIVAVAGTQPIDARSSTSAPNAGRSAPATVMITAHYDHLGPGHPGADDNASGVAVALAVARDLRRRPPSGRVVFVFTGGEEVGLVGAQAYAAAPTVPLADVRAVYNLDMVGRRFFGAAGDDERELAGIGLPEHPDLADAALEAAAAHDLKLLVLRAGALTAFGQSGRSDDWVFRERSVPSVHFSTGISEDYHRPTDTLDKVSPAKMLRVARFLRELVK